MVKIFFRVMGNDRRQSNKPQVPQAVQDCHRLIVWMIPQLDKFPRLRRYTLGERIETNLLGVLELLVEAAFSQPSRKRSCLQQANMKLEVTRHLWRMAFELKVVAMRSFEYGVKMMIELGRQLGGWVKSVK